MSHPLYWPGQYYFYPIGNTPAICLTRDLPPEEPANLLLLGCGDPRNILYTIFCEPQLGGRTLDFTCCDIDPAVLARNVLLLTMVADRQPYTTTVWNIFFHMKLDKDSYSILVEHCKKLVGLSDNLQRWNTSLYGQFIKMSTEYTLSQLRRHWSLYADMQNLPQQRIDAIRDSFSKKFEAPFQKGSDTKITFVFGAVRSAGPLFMKALHVTSEHSRSYRETGVTFSDPNQIANATLINPIFAYSLAGDLCSVHYGVDPLNSFHLAELFGNAKGSVSVADAVRSARTEFSHWCTAFHTSITPAFSNIPIICFFLGEATAVCRALRAFATTGVLETNIPVTQWKSQLIRLSRDEYVSRSAPVTFNVIDTSNLEDHIGLLNVLIASVPLLSISSVSTVLYTESLLFRGEDATREFAKILHANITTVGLLIGLCPVDYLTGFTTRSNTHELLLYRALKKKVPQFHQVTVWKAPTSGDNAVARAGSNFQPPVFDSHQLGTLLYDMYYQIFDPEDPRHFCMLDRADVPKALANSNLIHFIRESFVLFLKLIRDRLCISEERWSETMERFLFLHDGYPSHSMRISYQDLCAHLCRHGVYAVTPYHDKHRKIGRVSQWNTVPPLVRVILNIPREKLAVLVSLGESASTPLLQCEIRGPTSLHVFTAVHVAFGRSIPMGTKAHPRVVFNEDPEGWNGASSLVASFTMPTRLLTNVEPPENLRVCFSVRSTPASIMSLMGSLGAELSLFSAKLMDESHVQVLPEQPVSSRNSQISPTIRMRTILGLRAQIGESGAAVVGLDEECELVASLTCRVSVEDEEVKFLFSSGAMPHVAQVSPCVMNISIGRKIQDIVYPFPVIGSQCKLRLARKSLYIEAAVPVSGQFNPDGMKLNPFPVVGTEQALSPWSLHRINLSCLPILDVDAEEVDKWLNPLVGSAMSSREKSLRNKRKVDTLMFVKDSLHTIVVRSSGIQGGLPRRVFAMIDHATKNCDTIFFISDLRFDLPSHSIVCDGYVLSLTDELMPKIQGIFSVLLDQGNVVNVSAFEGEMPAWKQLLPAFVERCRSSWKHGDNCEYKFQGKIPLTQLSHEDPLCSCGKGKDIEGMSKVNLWSEFAPYVTRVALSPLFGVSYLETVGRDPAARRCFFCRGKGKPKVMVCAVCKTTVYCSRDCQKRDWAAHKTRCKS